MTYVTSVVERLAKGAALLDVRVVNWSELVYFHDLDMSSISTCVLGHVFGSFARGKEELNLDDLQISECGFDIYDCEYPPDDDGYYELEMEWLKYIES